MYKTPPGGGGEGGLLSAQGLGHEPDMVYLPPRESFVDHVFLKVLEVFCSMLALWPLGR